MTALGQTQVLEGFEEARVFGEAVVFYFSSRHDPIHDFQAVIVNVEERGLFSASRYFGKRQQVEDLQTSYAKAMEKFGLERGISKKITRACNIPLDEHRKEVAKSVEKLRETADKINEKQAELNKLLQQKENELEEIFKEDNKDNAGYFESKKAEDILR